MKFKKMTAMLSAAALLVGCLAGCGGKDTTDPGKPGKPSKNDGKESTTIEMAKYAYQAEYLPLATDGGEGVEYVQAFAVSGDKLYFAGEVKTGEEPAMDPETGEQMLDEEGKPVTYPVYDNCLFGMDLNSKEVKQLEYEKAAVPEGMRGDSHLRTMKAAADGTLWLLEEVSTYTLDVPEGVDPESPEAMDYYTPGENMTVLSHVDAAGKQLATMQLELPEDFYGENLYLDSKGNIYVCSWSTICVYDPQGSLITTIEGDGNGDVQQMNADAIGFTGHSEKGMVFTPVDLEKKALGEGIPLDDGAYEIMPGVGDYEYLYMRGGNNIYGHNKDTGKSEKLLDWMENDVNADTMDRNTMAFLEDGRVVCMERNSGETRSMNVVILTPMERSSVPQKKELTYACISLDWSIRPLIINFNRTHDDIRIVVRDYGESISDETTYQDAIQTLNTEILSGNVPDLIQTGNLPLERYAAKDLLLDLWPLIDGDKDLSRDDLMEHFFDVLSIDGKLYELASNFNIQTASVKKSIADGRTSWTLADVKEALSKLQPGAGIFGEVDTRDNMLQRSLEFDMDSFVNWEEKTCSFDSPAFVDVLNFAATFPAEFDWEHTSFDEMESDYSRLTSGKQLLNACWISQLQDVQVENAMHQGEATFIGFPSASGNGSAFSTPSGIAISAACKDVDAAWSFARELLLEKNQKDTWGFPTNRHAFEAKAKVEMTPQYEINPETGEKEEVSNVGIGIGDDFSLDLYAATQADYDLLMELYENCHTVARQDQDIMKLIQEEAGAFFAGQKTAEETAKLIQDRVGLYMMEQG